MASRAYSGGVSPSSESQNILIRGTLIAREVPADPQGQDGQLWHIDWEQRRITLEAVGAWSEIKSIFLDALGAEIKRALSLRKAGVELPVVAPVLTPTA